MDFGESMECNPPTPDTMQSHMWGGDIEELEMSSCGGTELRTTPKGGQPLSAGTPRGSVELAKNKKSTKRPTLLIAEVSLNIVSEVLNVYVMW